MLKSLFNSQREYLNHFFDNIDLEKAQKILKAFLNCKKNIIFTGIGKSGIIANKIATTMLSTGTQAFYISAMDAFHGDLGMISKDDLFVVFSKSGNTKEIIDLLFHVKKKNTKIVSVVSKKNSKLLRYLKFM